MSRREITITRPDDFHCHLRTNEMLLKVLRYSNYYGRVVAMGNLDPPITTGRAALTYRQKIINSGATFEPIMTIMLVNETTPQDIYEAHALGVKVLKMIPGGASTGSGQGVALKNLRGYYPVLKAVSDCKMIFSGHWELTHEPMGRGEIAEYSREARAIPYLIDVIDNFPDLKIVVEHVSTAAMVNLIFEAPANVGATITVHHLGPYVWGNVFNCVGMTLHPELYCKPVLKYDTDIEVVKYAALSGNKKFFFGSDSAPHTPEKKHTKPYAAGIFSAPMAYPWLWEFFDNNGMTPEAFENFTACFGAGHYGLPLNQGKITLVQEPWTIPHSHDGLSSYMLGRKLNWQVANYTT